METNAYHQEFRYEANGNLLFLHRSKQQTTWAISEFDELYYRYTRDGAGKLVNNRLNYVIDDALNTVAPTDLAGQDIRNQAPFNKINAPADTLFNYIYDEIGNLIRDSSEKILYIHWNVYRKPTEIYRMPEANKPVRLRFEYDAAGQRAAKRVQKRTLLSYESKFINLWDETATFYARDAQGNVLATYKVVKTYEKYNPSNPSERRMKVKEQLYWCEAHLYGTARVGIYTPDSLLSERNGVITLSLTDNIWQPTVQSYDPSVDKISYTNNVYSYAGKRNFEISNHLGNVLSVVSDKKIAVYSSGTFSHYIPDISFASDYFVFGQSMTGRIAQVKSYRYGFNGMERDKSEWNTGDMYDTDFRSYDPRVCRWLSVDPITHEWESPFAGFHNNPIFFMDPSGLSGVGTGSAPAQSPGEKKARFYNVEKLWKKAEKFAKKVGKTLDEDDVYESQKYIGVSVSYTDKRGAIRSKDFSRKRGTYDNMRGRKIPTTWSDDETRTILTAIPFVSDGADIGYTAKDFIEGDYVGAATGAALIFVPNIIEKPLKWIWKGGKKRVQLA